MFIKFIPDLIARIYILLLLFVFSFWQAKGQSYTTHTRQLNVDDGLTNRFVTCIRQDSRGLMWFGTRNGLNRYDGYEFRRFTKESHGLSGNVILFILEDVFGMFYLIQGVKGFNNTEHDLTFWQKLDIDVWNPVTEKAFPFGEFFEGQCPFRLEDVTQIKQLPEREIWFQTKSGQCYTYNGQFSPVFRLDEGMVGSTEKVEIIPAGDFFWVIDSSRLMKLSREGQVLERDKLPFGWRFTDAWAETENSLWLTIGKNLTPGKTSHRVERVLFRKESGKALAETKPVVKIAPDNSISGNFQAIPPNAYHNGLFWTNFSGTIVAVDKNQQVVFRSFYDFPSLTKKADDLYLDKNNDIWLATEDGVGIVSIKKNPFKKYFNALRYKFSFRGIAEDKSGNIYANSYNGFCVVPADGTAPRVLNKTMGLGLWIDADGSFWSGVSGFLINIRQTSGSDIRWIHSDSKGPGQTTWVLHRDAKSNHMFVGTHKGLVRYDPKKDSLVLFEQYNGFTALSDAEILHFYENEEGLWIASSKGLFLLDTDKGIKAEFSAATGDLPDYELHHIYEDKEGIFWLSSRQGGLIKWNRTNRTYRQYTKADGLSHNNIHAAYEDDLGNLWLPSDYGLMRFNKESEKVEVFMPDNGLPHEEFNRISHYRAKDGRLWFGTLNGLVSFHPNDISFQQSSGDHLIVSAFTQLDEKTGKMVDKTAQLHENREIHIRPGDKMTVLKFTLSDFKNPSQNYYAWRIKGLHEVWIFQQENSILLGGLPYGFYTLELKGHSSGNKWVEEVLSIPLHVLAPFYLTWPFILFAIVAVGLMLFGIVRWRIRWLRRDRARLAKEVAKQTEELEQKNKELKALNVVKDQFFAIIAHDMRSPLITLGSLAKKVNFLIRKNRTEEIQTLGNAVEGAVQGVHKLLDNLLNWALVQRGVFPYNPEIIEVAEIVGKILELYKNTAEAKDIHLESRIPKGVKLFGDREAINAIIRNLVDNALKFTEKKGKVSLSAKRENGRTIIEVADTGKGIHSEKLARLFELKGEKGISGTQGEQGSGLGLVLCKELVEMNRGDIKVESTPFSGTVFSVYLPSKN